MDTLTGMVSFEMWHIQDVFDTSWHIRPALCFTLNLIMAHIAPTCCSELQYDQGAMDFSTPQNHWVHFSQSTVHGYAWTKAKHGHVSMLWHATSFLSVSVKYSIVKWLNSCTFDAVWTKDSSTSCVGYYMQRCHLLCHFIKLVKSVHCTD